MFTLCMSRGPPHLQDVCRSSSSFCDQEPGISTIPSVPINTNNPMVKTPHGLILGTHKKSYDGRIYSAFEGIPYARPPVGNLRFEEPQPSEAWENILVANRTYMCINFMSLPAMSGIFGTEDCLYAYVYVPREAVDPNENLDVVVHIHGGAFMMGLPRYLAGPVYIMDQDVVYVSFNYRLGVLGFLSTEDDVVPGNNGLKDQTLALKWIQENIKYFGGNSNSVTITGLSAGAVSVHYHYLSPLSKGLFHKGLSQSGTALQCWSLVEQPLQNAKIIARALNCTTASTKELVDCVKQHQAKDVVEAVKKTYVYFDGVPFVPFGPVIEKGGVDPFISDNPYRILERGEINDVPWVTSNTIHEGIFPTGMLMMIGKLNDLNENWTDLMMYALELQNTVEEKNKRFVMDKIKKFYFKNEPITMDNLYNLINLFSDRHFLVDVRDAIKLHAKASKSPVYYYLFGYALQMPSFFPAMQTKKGVAHGDDSRLLFHIIGTPGKLAETDEEMMRQFTDFLANYAKTGIPTFHDANWTQVDDLSDEINYLYIEGPETMSAMHNRTLAPNDFWKSLPINELKNFKFSTSTSVKIATFSSSVLNCLVIGIYFLIN